MDFNKVIIVGRVVANPEMRSTPTGQSVTSLSVATNRSWTGKTGEKKEEAEFHNVVLWGRQAEVASQFLTKGATVLIEGRLQTRIWNDKQGVQHRTTEILAERMQLGPRFSGNSDFKSSDSNKSSKKEEDIPTINLEDDDMKSLDDIPF
jgi:single-strand DNA-binding protein